MLVEPYLQMRCRYVVLQYVAFYAMKGHVLHAKRPPFATQKAAF